MPHTDANLQVTGNFGAQIANCIADVSAALTSSTVGTLTSAASASTDITGLTGPNFNLQLDGDPTVQNIVVVAGTLNTGAGIATAIQTAIQGLSGVPVAYKTATCTFGATKYVISTPTKGSAASVLVTPGATATGSTADCAAALKLTAAASAVQVRGTDTGIFASKATGTPQNANSGTAGAVVVPTAAFQCIANVNSKLMVNTDVTGNLYLLKDGTAYLLASAMTAGTPYVNSSLPLMSGSYYDLAFSAVGARLSISWVSSI